MSNIWKAVMCAFVFVVIGAYYIESNEEKSESEIFLALCQLENETRTEQNNRYGALIDNMDADVRLWNDIKAMVPVKFDQVIEREIGAKVRAKNDLHQLKLIDCGELIHSVKSMERLETGVQDL